MTDSPKTLMDAEYDARALPFKVAAAPQPFEAYRGGMRSTYPGDATALRRSIEFWLSRETFADTEMDAMYRVLRNLDNEVYIEHLARLCFFRAQDAVEEQAHRERKYR